MSSQDKIKRTSKTNSQTPLIIEERDDDCELKPIRSSKSKAKASRVVKNQFIDFESVEENPGELEEVEAVGEQEINYVSSDVEEQVGEKTEENENQLQAGERGEDEGGEENERNGVEEYVEEGEEDEEVEEVLPCLLCKSDMKIVTKDVQQMLFCSAGATVCTLSFTMPAMYLALCEMSKAVHPRYMHTKKGTPPFCQKHNIPMALSFSKSSSEQFAHRPVFKCAVQASRNPLTNREDSSFVKCANGLFGN